MPCEQDRRKKRRNVRKKNGDEAANNLRRHTSTDTLHTKAIISYLEVKFLIKEVASESVGEIQDCGDDHTANKMKKKTVRV